MNRIRLTSLLLVLALVLPACSPDQPPPPAPDPEELVATQVAVLLTSSPPSEPPPPMVATATLPAPTPEEPTPTPEPTETPAATPTETVAPLPTSTPPTTDPRLALGSPTFQDKSFKPDLNWGGAWENDFTKGSFKDNQLVLTSVGVDGWTLSWPQPENFYIEMTAQTGSCSGMDRYGLIVRVPNSYDRGYLFGFTCDGQYSLRKWDPEAKKYVTLVNWTRSDQILTGSNQSNRLGLKVDRGRFELYANGHYLTNASDDQLKDGRFGLFIGHDKTDNFTVFVTEVAYWDLP